MRRLMVILVAAALAVVLVPAIGRTAPTAPAGVSSIALDAKVALSWKASSGASSYKIYRGTSAGSITTQVGTSASTTYVDTTAANNTTYYYAVRATGSGDSSPSSATQAKPLAKSCSTGNAVVQENCFPGSTSWRATAAGPYSASSSNIEGFATEQSVNAGSSFDIKVNTADNVGYRIEIYRMGYYGGAHARLVSTIPGLTGVEQPSCNEGSGNTGLIECSNWSTAATVTTSTSWPSGVYMMRLVRTDNGNDNNVLMVVRNDGSTSDVLYGVPTATYEAYNNYGDRSLYDFNSSGANTVAGTPRAVKVSFDRPYAMTYFPDHNWFGTNDAASTAFLERNGYDVTYVASSDLHSSPSQVASHKTFVSPTHDEYWSTEMRNGVTSARNAGTGLFWMGSNQVYWKIRFETNAATGAANRTEVAYKSTQGGAVDPVSPTGTWRDPAGANAPENALVGQMYIGDNDQTSFRLGVSAAEGKSRVWRHTDLGSLATGTSTQLGLNTIGWEWNARVANGLEPAGTQTWTSSAVTGELVQHDGRDYQAGAAATVDGTIYKAASGAYVVSTGTNNWWRGLELDGTGDGEPNIAIQQATINILADMRSKPTTPLAGLVVETGAAPTISDRSPASGATGVPTDSSASVTFDTSLDPSTVTTSNLWLTTAGGSTVPASVSYDEASRTATVNPTNSLGSHAVYTVHVKGGSAGIASWGGPLAADATWSFTTGAGTPPAVISTTPDPGAGSVAINTTVKATFDRDMTASTITSSSFTLSPQVGSPVAATVTYDAASATATLTPATALDPSRQYTATLTTAVQGGDGTALAAAKTWSFTTADPITVTDKVPAPLATGVSAGAIVRATFSRAADATTLTTANVTLKTSGGTSVTGTVSYDATTRTASFVPSAKLALSTTYTAKVAAAVKAADGSTLGADVSWTFTTAATQTAAPTVVATSPSAGATSVPTDNVVTATFDRAMDAATITGQNVLLRDSASVTVAATISYDAASQTARITPTAALGSAKVYTAQLTTAVRAADGTPLAATVTWSFTTADCPCSLLNGLTPQSTNLDVADGRTGTGLTYEMGMKFTVDKTMKLTGLRFYKDAGETGTHVGRLWNAAGAQVGTATFAGETASGWQRATLASPATLTANATYTISVGLNRRFVMTAGGLSSAIDNGPLHNVTTSNGVFANAAGTFPSQSWNGSSYFVDPVVANTTASTAPALTSRTPVSGATGVDTAGTVTATFGGAMDAASLTSSTFALTTSGGSTVPATVSYDSSTRTATLTPNAALSPSASYTAKLTTGVRSDDGTPLAAQQTWSFSTMAAAAPTVASTSPVAAATGIAPNTTVQATFSASMDPATLTASTFTLTGPSGAVTATVAYDDATKTATLTPSSALAGNVAYTATVTTGAKSALGTALGAAKTWSFTTFACPCSAMGGLTPTYTGLDTRDGRAAPGPWSYELGTKIKVTSAASLTAIRFYKDAGETGTHTATLWSATGSVIATATYTGESASGWQEAALSTPVALTPGSTYVISVGFNARFVMTASALGSPLVNGPLQTVADGANGVIGDAAGVFPTASWANSSYFVDAVVQ
ncbi:MAG: hypothetical protein JWR63_4244 [Conexibacter sp.]|nr:hypothetical protein [Conexibacter sp.]